MSSFALRVSYEFHPVGQGLFAAGGLSREKDDRLRLRWVYDCGTSSKQALLKQAIRNLAREANGDGSGRPRLDLVTVSHFDADHISGLVSLLSKFSVNTLLLPYMALWQRLLVALAEGVDTQQEMMQFFVNPVAYIAGRRGVEIKRIVLVPGGSHDGRPEEGNITSAPPEGDGPWELVVDAADPIDEDQIEDLTIFRTSGGARGISVELMRAGGSLRAAMAWEFVPYNDAHVMPKPTPAFRKAVAAKRTALLDASSDSSRRSALVALKDLYDKHFGKSGKQRNVISLFLYAGPISARAGVRWRWLPTEFRGPLWSRWSENWWRRGPLNGRCSVLYTGDGYLETKAKLERLCRFLRDYRTERVFCLQVMHHGAKGNWHPGLAERFAPDISVFSSDPSHKGLGHPHASVLRDFWPYFPVQVDQRSGVRLRGTVVYR